MVGAVGVRGAGHEITAAEALAHRADLDRYAGDDRRVAAAGALGLDEAAGVAVGGGLCQPVGQRLVAHRAVGHEVVRFEMKCAFGDLTAAARLADLRHAVAAARLLAGSQPRTVTSFSWPMVVRRGRKSLRVSPHLSSIVWPFD